MIPSSRTPEGEPLQCQICGAASKVDVSKPPSDTVCPSCGAHAWWANRVDTTKSQIRNYIAELSALCRSDLSVNKIGEFLVSGLTQCLAAQGAVLWVDRKRNWWSMRRTLRIAACVGEPESPLFAQEVISTKHEIIRDLSIAGRETLVIGVTITRDNQVVGVIEVLKRTGSVATARNGYVRFISQMADIVSGCSAMSTR
jgi:hypothetical protein